MKLPEQHAQAHVETKRLGEASTAAKLECNRQQHSEPAVSSARTAGERSAACTKGQSSNGTALGATA